MCSLNSATFYVLSSDMLILQCGHMVFLDLIVAQCLTTVMVWVPNGYPSPAWVWIWGNFSPDSGCGYWNGQVHSSWVWVRGKRTRWVHTRCHLEKWDRRWIFLEPFQFYFKKKLKNIFSRRETSDHGWCGKTHYHIDRDDVSMLSYHAGQTNMAGQKYHFDFENKFWKGLVLKLIGLENYKISSRLCERVSPLTPFQI